LQSFAGPPGNENDLVTIGTEHGGSALVELLVAHGVKVVFGLPGGQTAALYDAIERDDRIAHVGVHDERSAAYAADAYARLTRSVGVCDATVGPGTAKLPSGLGEAFNSSIPVLALVSELPTSTEARWHRGATSQALDQEALLAPVTKWVGTVRRIDDLGPMVRRAFREATTGRPGPVAVIIHQDILDGPMPTDSQATDPHAARFGTFPATSPVPAPEDLAALHQLLDRAERPLLIVGGGAVGPGSNAVLKRLADGGIAVATTLSGKGAIDEQHPMAVGVLGSLGTPAARAAASAADLLVVAGSKLGSGATLGWSIPKPGQQVAQIDIDPVELGRDRPVDVIVHADALATLAALHPAERERDEWRAAVGEARADWFEQRSGMWSSAETPIDPQRVMGELQRLLADGHVVVADASLSSGWVGAFLESDGGLRTLFPRGLAGLGWAIPAAVGAVEAGAPRIVAVMGDGAAPYAIGELATLARQGAPVVMVVLNNSSFGWIRWYRRLTFGRGWEEPDLPPTRFSDVAAAYGLHAERVEDPERLAGAFAEAFAVDGPSLIEVVTSMWETPIAAHREALERNETASY
jgi:acetolactate synthase I/II/III large subunit